MANHALLIGVDRYKTRRESLSGSVADAVALAQWLVGHGKVAPENVQLALAPNERDFVVPPELARCARIEPSLEGIDQALRQLRRTLAEAPAERLFVGFSGHGASANQSAYTEEALCLEGYTSTLFTRALEVRSFLMVINAIPAVERFIFIDGCRNHVFEDDCRFGVLGQQPPRAPGVTRNYILRATIPGRKAVEAEGRGLFSRHLVAGLRGEGAAKHFEFSNDGVGGSYHVTWKRLFAHVQKRVGENVTANRLMQLVMEDGERPDGDPIIATYKQDSFPEAQLIVSLESPDTPPAGMTIRYLRDGLVDPQDVPFPATQTKLALSLPQSTFRLAARAPGHNWVPARHVVELYEPQQQVEFALVEDGPPPPPFAFVTNADQPVTEQPPGNALDVGRSDPEKTGEQASVQTTRMAQGVVGFEDQGDTLQARTPRGTSYAVINGFSVITFDPTLSAQEEEDMVFFLYFAQRAASVRVDRLSAPLPWREAYLDALGNLGAARQQELLSSGTVSGEPAETLAVAHNLMVAAGAGPAGGALADTLDELHNMLGVQRFVVPDDQTTIRDFELGAVRIEDDGAVVFTLAGFRLKTDEPRRVLWVKFGKEKAELEARISTFVINRQLREAIRSTLMTRLRATLDVSVEGIPLADIVPAPILELTREAGTVAWHEILPGNVAITLDPGLWRLRLTTAEGRTVEQLIDLPPMEPMRLDLGMPAPGSLPLAATLAAAYKPPPTHGFITPTEIAGPIYHGSLVTIATFAVALAATQHRYGDLDRLGLGALWHEHEGEGLELVIADETGGTFRPLTAWLNSFRRDEATDARQLSRPDRAVPLATTQFALSPGTYLAAWRDEINADAPQTMLLAALVPGHVTLVVRHMPEEGGAFHFQFACPRQASDLTATLKALARAEAVQRSLLLGRDPATDPNVATLAQGGWFEPFTVAAVAATALDRGERELAAALAGRLASSGALPADSAALAALLDTDGKTDEAHAPANLDSIASEIFTARLRLLLVQRGLIAEQTGVSGPY